MKIDAVIGALLPDPPGAAELIAVVLDGIALQRIGRVNDNLIAGLVLQRLEVAFNRRSVGGRQKVRIVDDAAGERGEFRLRAGGNGNETCSRQQHPKDGGEKDC